MTNSDGDKDRVDVVNGGPFISEDVEAQRAIAINIRVEHWTNKSHLRCLFRIIVMKFQFQGEDATSKEVRRDSRNFGESRTFPLGLIWTENCSIP